ncbi:ImmA/IrrE family metallo-endopeptidase [Kribbella solani]|uniref:ImmA/IrrE family metallo-endopeptidase n=1 Tax=Kribbella solani TaxID=236067 RepID=UPI00161DB8C7
MAKRIVIADHLDDFRAVARLVHELAHVRLHSPAALRAGLGLVRDGEDRGAEMWGGIREVEAESVAYVVLAHHGLPTGAASFEYLAEWARQVDSEDPASAIKATGARVVNVARRLIDSTDRYLKNDRTTLGPVPARPLDSAFLMPDLDGPAR